MTRFKFLTAPFLLAAMLLQPAMAQDNTAPADTAPAETAPADAAPTADSAAPADAMAADTAPAPAAEPVKHIEQVANPYGIEAAWKGGDFVSKGAFIILGLMSAATWYILITKLIEQQKLFGQAAQTRKVFWSSGSVKDGQAKLKSGTPFWYMADKGIKASDHHEGTLVEQIDLSSWVTMSVQRAVDEISSRLQSGLAVLATVGSTAPFVGLFGTVWGIYHALTAIGLSGQASIDKVAGPVGEALIMTALGLAVAVPAVMGYNWLVRRNKTALEYVRTFAGDLHSVLLSGGAIKKS